MNAPSSTITAAGLGGLGTTLFWALLNWLYLTPHAITLDPEIVALSTTFVASLIGYFKRETVYTMMPKE